MTETSFSSLTADQIADLLKGEPRPGTSASRKNQLIDSFYKPIQVGPLKWFEPPGGHCASRGCTVPTLMQVEGVWYCASHALYRLNEMMLESWMIDECTCDSGKYSKHNIHNSRCPVYIKLKEANG